MTATDYSSFAQESKPEVVQESYLAPFGIKDLTLSTTRDHIAGRNLIILTTENKLYRYRDLHFSARRPVPKSEEQSAGGFFDQLKEELEELENELNQPLILKSSKLPEYEPVLPQINT